MTADLMRFRLLLLTLAGWISRHQQDVIDYLVEENRVLKERFDGKALRLTDNQRRRLAAKAKRVGRQALNRLATIVTPDTLMRWHRRLIALKWTYTTSRAGRPGLMKAVKALIVRMARENSLWGYCRIQGELKDVGHKVASTTIANVLKENGIKPAPDRPSSWQAFIKAHWGQIAATDFFTVEVWSPKGLVTHYVLFLIDLKTRSVEIAGITTSPNESFMAQVARNLTDGMGGFLSGCRALVCDRDSKFKRILRDEGVEVVLTPKQAPNCNAYAERFVLSIKSECLGKMVFFGVRSLERAVLSYVEHYHAERAHQGIGNEKVQRAPCRGSGPVECHERLGGILKSYRRAA